MKYYDSSCGILAFIVHDQNLLNSHISVSFVLDAIRTRYRISKHHYETFYKERIKETLAGCIYNVGVRKPKKQLIQQQTTAEDSTAIEQ